MRWLFLPILFTLFFSSLVFAEGSPIDTAEGVVVKVVDGNKINVNSEGMILKIRLYGIDAPEKMKISLKTGEVNKAGQPFGEESWKALENKVYHQKVQLEIIDIDRYGRMVAIVWLRGREINKEMVAEGWAWAYRKYIHDPTSVRNNIRINSVS
jgi:micrococcal nuclease